MPKKKVVFNDEYFYKHLVGKAQSHGTATAYGYFLMFLNPKYRGAGFKWEKLEEMTIRMSEATAWHQFSEKEWKHFEKQIKASARQSAKETVKYCLEESAILSWWDYDIQKDKVNV